MASRYQQLRRAIANLAAPAEAQLAHLDTIFGADAASYGVDELVLEFEDIHMARDHMLECGEITAFQASAPAALDALLVELSGFAEADFWARNALRSDLRWEHVRTVAREALAAFPDE